MCPLDQQGLRGQGLPGSEVIAEPIEPRLEHGERFRVGLPRRRVRVPRPEGHLHVVPGVLRRLLDGRVPAEDDQISERNPLPA